MMYSETFPGSSADLNADLNEFFPDESAFQPYIDQQAVSLAQPSWSDGIDLLKDDFDSQISVQLAFSPNAAESSQNTTYSPTTTAINEEVPTAEEASPPKRGRPRKSRAKKQLTAQQEQVKRQKFLERNRLAASKCRDRRKIHTEEMVKKYKAAQQLNEQLRSQISCYRAEFERMVAGLLAHQQAGCVDEEILKMLNDTVLLELLNSSFDESSMFVESSPSPSRETSVIPSRHQSFSSSARDSGFSSIGSVKTESPRGFDDEGYTSREPRMIMSTDPQGTPKFSIEPDHIIMFGQ